jgi:hypothetical protein
MNDIISKSIKAEFLGIARHKEESADSPMGFTAS